MIVRCADDFVVGFEHREDAERFWTELRDRLAKFGLELNAEKTRLIEFGRHAARDRTARGLGKPETFQFLGFTHICGKTRKSGRFKLMRITDSKRVRAKLLAVKGEMARRMHLPIPEQGALARQRPARALRYYAVPDNIEALTAFRKGLIRHWLRTLRRRSQKSRLTGSGWGASLIDGYLDRESCIPGPSSDSPPSPKAGAQCGSPARWDLCGGRPEAGVDKSSRPDRRVVPTRNRIVARFRPSVRLQCLLSRAYSRSYGAIAALSGGHPYGA